jgi:hypothetical protein
MKKQLLKFSLMLFSASALLLTSCEKDKDEEHDEEVITTMQLTFVPVGGGATVTYKFDDPDGPGGANPTKDQIVLATGKTYNVTLQLLNKTANPVADITTEIAAEAASLCPGLDSNQHTSRRCHLKTVRLPISPPGHPVRHYYPDGVQI